MNDLVSVIRAARDLQEPALVHVVTKKGKGYAPAEEDPAKFHGIGKFDPETGKKLAAKVYTFSDSFGDTLVSIAKQQSNVCAITAAMPGGTGLLKYMRQFPERLFDVGIAEEHAVSMAGGLAKQGMVPVVALYSTFLQRAFDQMMQDVALLHLHVVFAIDRAGLVGDDGPTHHGVFDVGFLRQIPGFCVLAPASLKEQQEMLCWAIRDCNGPVAVRYPRGTEGAYTASSWDGKQKAVRHRAGRDVTLITYGIMINSVLEAAERLEATGISAAVVRLMQLTDISAEALLPLLSDNKQVVVVEEAAANSGVKQAVAWELMQHCPDFRVSGIDLGDGFVTHGAQKRLYEACGLDAASIANFVSGVLEHEK